MIEGRVTSPLPEVDLYTNGNYDFAQIDADTTEKIPAGHVVRFWHDESNRLYVFECTNSEQGSFTEGWLTRFVNGQIIAEREYVKIDSRSTGQATDIRTKSDGSGSVVFTSEDDDTKSRLTVPFNQADTARVPEIAAHLLASAQHEQEMAPFEALEAQNVLRQAAAFFQERAKASEDPDLTTVYDTTATTIADNLID